MYKMTMKVDELNATMHYNDFATAVKEFKECVVEAFSKTNETDDYIMKITKDYAIFIVECNEASFKVELTKEVK